MALLRESGPPFGGVGVILAQGDSFEVSEVDPLDELEFRKFFMMSLELRPGAARSFIDISHTAAKSSSVEAIA